MHGAVGEGGGGYDGEVAIGGDRIERLREEVRGAGHIEGGERADEVERCHEGIKDDPEDERWFGADDGSELVFHNLRA